MRMFFFSLFVWHVRCLIEKGVRLILFLLFIRIGEMKKKLIYNNFKNSWLDGYASALLLPIKWV